MKEFLNRAISPCLYCTRVKDPVNCENKNCKVWQKWFLSRWEDMLLSNMVHREELANTLSQAKLWVSTTDRALGALTPEEKLILYRMYMYPERNALDRLCQELDLEQSSIYRRRDQALNRFVTAYYGILN